jgi:zinc and cadmium transporter
VTPATLAAGIVAAAANVVGAAGVTMRARWHATALSLLVAMAAGFMLAVALTDLLPDAIRQGGQAAAVVALAGYLAVHLVQHTAAEHMHLGRQPETISPVATVSAFAGLLLHTFFDGVAIASGFGVSSGLGVLVFIAITLHKVPEGVAVSSLFLAAGASRARALGAATLLAVATLLGLTATSVSPWLSSNGLALSAGVTLYVAASNLVPEIRRHRGWRFAAACLGGSALYLAARSIVGV